MSRGVGPGPQPSPRPPSLGGPSPAAAASGPPTPSRTPRSNSLDVFEPHTPRRGGGNGASTIAWFGDAGAAYSPRPASASSLRPGSASSPRPSPRPVVPSAPPTPRRSAPSPRRAPSPRASTRSPSPYGVPMAAPQRGSPGPRPISTMAVSRSAQQLKNNATSPCARPPFSHLTEGPPGKLPEAPVSRPSLGERLRQLPTSSNSQSADTAPVCPSLSSAMPLPGGDESSRWMTAASESLSGTEQSMCSQFVGSDFSLPGPIRPESSQRPPLMAPSTCEAPACSSMSLVPSGVPRVSSGQRCSGLATVSAEEAALAAGALAELRASLAVIVGRIERIEAVHSDDAPSQRELSQVISKQKKLQADLNKQAGSVQDIRDRLSTKLDESLSQWHAGHDHLELRISNVEISCKDLDAACASSAALRDNDCIKELDAEWQAKHRHVDSRILSLEQSCRDLHVRVAEAVQATSSQSYQADVQSEFDMRLDDLQQKLQEHTGSLESSREQLDSCGKAIQQNRQASDEQANRLQKAIANMEKASEQQRNLLSTLDQSQTSLESNMDGRLKSLEAFRAGWTDELPWQSTLDAISDKVAELEKGHEPKVHLSWEMESRLRDISEEVYSASERALTTYIGAVRTELSKRLDELAEQFSSGPLPQQDPMELSLSCSDAFVEAVAKADCTAAIHKNEYSDARNAKACSTDAAYSVPDKVKMPWPPSSAAGRATSPRMWLDGGTGSYQSEASTASSKHHRANIEASLNSWPSRSPGPQDCSPKQTASHGAAPVWRPAGSAGKPRDSPRSRLRSGSPGNRF